MINKRPMPKFRKGTIVMVVDNGRQYENFEVMAKQLGTSNWKNSRELKEGTEVAIINFGFRGDVDGRTLSPWEGDYTIPIYLVRDNKGKEYLIEEDGLTNGWFSRQLYNINNN